MRTLRTGSGARDLEGALALQHWRHAALPLFVDHRVGAGPRTGSTTVDGAAVRCAARETRAAARAVDDLLARHLRVLRARLATYAARVPRRAVERHVRHEEAPGVLLPHLAEPSRVVFPRGRAAGGGGTGRHGTAAGVNPPVASQGEKTPTFTGGS